MIGGGGEEEGKRGGGRRSGGSVSQSVIYLYLNTNCDI